MDKNVFALSAGKEKRFVCLKFKSTINEFLFLLDLLPPLNL